MRFGLRLLQHLGSPRRLIELASLAEEAGFDQVWFPHDPFMLNTWALAAASAEHTARIQIGSLATNPYTIDPSEIATFLATLDLLSGGRATIGVGMHTQRMVQWIGYDTSNYIARTRETIEIIRILLRGEVAEYQGTEFRWTEHAYLRFPASRPRIPIYIAAFGSEFLRLSGAIGDGSLPMITPPESAASIVGTIIAGAHQAGRDPAKLDIAGCAWLSLSGERQQAVGVLRPIIAYFGPYLEAQLLAKIGLHPADFDPIRQLLSQGDHQGAAASVTDAMLRLAIVGTPGDVIERLEFLAQEGITQVNLGGPLGPDAEEAIQLMGQQVIPHFR